MASNQKPMDEMNAFARQMMQQTLQAVDEYFDFVKKAISSSPTGGTELGEKVKNYAETNVTATHEFIKRLSQAKDFQEMMRIQTEFMQEQMKEFGEQTRESWRDCNEGDAKYDGKAVLTL